MVDRAKLPKQVTAKVGSAFYFLGMEFQTLEEFIRIVESDEGK